MLVLILAVVDEGRKEKCEVFIIEARDTCALHLWRRRIYAVVAVVSSPSPHEIRQLLGKAGKRNRGIEGHHDSWAW